MSIEHLNLALKVTGITPTKKFILVILANYCDENGSCYPSHRHIANKIGLKDTKGVQKTIKEFQQLGYLTVEKRWKESKTENKKEPTSNRYHLTLEGVSEPLGGGANAPTLSVSEPPYTKKETKPIQRNKKEDVIIDLAFKVKNIYHEHFPEHKIKNISSTHLTNLTSVTTKPPVFETKGKLEKQKTNREEWWDWYFNYCSKSQQLKEGWQFEDNGQKVPDLEFFTRRRSIEKVLNGDYHPEKQGATR
jgi:pyocin large subunit-like protein